MRLIGIKCRNLMANKWEQTKGQIAGCLFRLRSDISSLWGVILNMLTVPLADLNVHLCVC